ncbi:MAG: hypothetical protein FJZ49_00150 [Candidatus Verstraetearchaeota archaeon]|nr:hypothetical protein [Candidatus Verstraetearchaeota archaeon]
MYSKVRKLRRMAVIILPIIALVAVSASALVIQAIAAPPTYPDDYLEIRDASMNYIATHHEDAVPFMGLPSWSYLGNGTFRSGGWTVVIKGDLSSASVTVDYSISFNPNYIGIPHRIIWEGSFAGGAVQEISYIHAQ